MPRPIYRDCRYLLSAWQMADGQVTIDTEEAFIQVRGGVHSDYPYDLHDSREFAFWDWRIEL